MTIEFLYMEKERELNRQKPDQTEKNSGNFRNGT